MASAYEQHNRFPKSIERRFDLLGNINRQELCSAGSNDIRCERRSAHGSDNSAVPAKKRANRWWPIERLPFEEIRVHSLVAKWRAVHFGFSYENGTGKAAENCPAGIPRDGGARIGDARVTNLLPS
jgi:hypothetical protein